MPDDRTRAREQNQRNYHAFYSAHPEQTLKDQARQKRYQEESQETADRHGSPWDTIDASVVLNLDIPIIEAARMSGRTYAAVRQGRYRLLKRMSIENSLIKDETDLYDGSIRRKGFDLEETADYIDVWAALGVGGVS